eukprot:264720-Prymnesium_polylepis.1
MLCTYAHAWPCAWPSSMLEVPLVTGPLVPRRKGRKSLKPTCVQDSPGDGLEHSHCGAGSYKRPVAAFQRPSSE